MIPCGWLLIDGRFHNGKDEDDEEEESRMIRQQMKISIEVMMKKMIGR